MRKHTRSFLAPFIAMASLSAVADDHSIWEDITEPAFGLWSVGAIARTSPYEDVDTSVAPTVLVFGGYGDLFLEGNRFGYNFYRDGTWFSSLVGNVRNHLSLSDEQIDDSDVLSAYDLDERESALEAGIQIGRRLPGDWIARVAFLQDLSGRHNSQEVDFTIFRRDNIGPFRLLTTFGAQYQAAEFNDYYFGIDRNELAQAGQETYRPGAGWSGELEMIATYDFEWNDWGEWAGYAGLRHYQHNSAATDSPIVETGLVQQYFIGLGKYF